MITENQIEQIVEKLVDRVEQANTKYLKSIGSSIKAIRDLSSTEAQQLIQILKYGGKYEDIIKQIAKITDLNINDIDKIFSNYAKKDQLFYEKFYKYKDIPFTPFDANMPLKGQTMALANMVKNEMYNFTRSNVLGYTIDGKFYNMRDTYNKLLDEAFLNIGQGKETFDSAMQDILKQVGGSGLKTLEYESGRSIRLDSAVRMHLKGRLRELHNENQKIIGDEIGADGIEISVHTNPAEDHEQVQGRQFSNEEYDKLNSGLEAKDYKGNTYTLDHDEKNGYRPISEMNCYHYIFSIVLGVSDPEYTDKQLKEIIDNNEKGFEFEGKHYTNYQGTQAQRNLERAIREQKDTQILAKASGNDLLVAQSQDKIRILTNKYKELNKVSGLPAKADRLRVSGYKRTKVGRPVEYTKNERYAINQYLSPYSIGLNEKLRNHWKLDDTDKMVKRNLDSALIKTNNYNGKIVRVMQMDNPYEFITQLGINEEFSTNQYLSFSTKEGYNDNANIKIYVNDSKKSKDLTSLNKGESETLYQRNEKFITEKIEKKKGIYYIYWKEK